MNRKDLAMLSCGAVGGRNPKTGKRVGSRHRWEDGWGRGRCRYCFRSVEELYYKPVATP